MIDLGHGVAQLAVGGGEDPVLPTPSPKRYRQTDYTARAKARIAAGRHPAAFPGLLRRPAGERCGTCVHLVRVQPGDRVYLKCDARITSSAASDIRKWWPACERWAPEANRG